MFFPGLEGCECGPSLPCSLLSHCFLYIRSPPSGKLELLLAYPASASCFSFLVAFVHISSPWDTPPFLVWFHHSCLWAWSRGRLILVSSKDIGDFILIGGEKKNLTGKTDVLFIGNPLSFPFSPVARRFYFPDELCHIMDTMAANFPKTTFSSLAASLLKRGSLLVTLGKSPGVDSCWLSMYGSHVHF